MKRTLIFLALVGSMAVYGDAGGEGNNTGCNGVGNPNSPCQPAPNPPVVPPTVGGDVNVEVTANGGNSTSNSNSGASSDSSSRSSANASSASTSTSDATAAANSSSGDSSATAAGGNAEGGNVGDINVDASQRNEFPSASAASVVAAQCQTAASGQTRGGGGAINFPDTICENAFAAEFLFNQARIAFEMDRMDRVEYLLTEYDKRVDIIVDYMNSNDFLADVDKKSSFLIRPAAILGALIWLL